MDSTFYDRAARGLPNFPRQVIDIWFEHVELAGWPPTFDANGLATGVWRTRVFRDRPIAFWRSVSWSLERISLTLRLLETDSMDLVNQLRLAFALGLPHPPGIPVPGASDRIRGFVAILQQTGRLPVPPLLLAVGNAYEVLDGNHRLAALVHAQMSGILVDAQHHMWVARAARGALRGADQASST